MRGEKSACLGFVLGGGFWVKFATSSSVGRALTQGVLVGSGELRLVLWTRAFNAQWAESPSAATASANRPPFITQTVGDRHRQRQGHTETDRRRQTDNFQTDSRRLTEMVDGTVQ